MPGAKTSTIPPTGSATILRRMNEASRSPPPPHSAAAVDQAPRAAAPIITTRPHPPLITPSGLRAEPGARTRTRLCSRILPHRGAASAGGRLRRRIPAAASSLRKFLVSRPRLICACPPLGHITRLSGVDPELWLLTLGDCQAMRCVREGNAGRVCTGVGRCIPSPVLQMYGE